MGSKLRTAGVLAVAGLSAVVALVSFAQSGARGKLAEARYDPMGRLPFPADTDRWINVGTGLGGNYADEPFDPANPGSFGVTQMEPSAYDYFLEHGEYADGTMFLLTFYATQKKPEPALQGFVQGEIVGREIHVIDRSRFKEEGSGFFVYPGGVVDTPVASMPLGSPCIVCHSEHGVYDATFVQFYPALRGKQR
jgi:hypothetical protein